MQRLDHLSDIIYISYIPLSTKSIHPWFHWIIFMISKHFSSLLSRKRFFRESAVHTVWNQNFQKMFWHFASTNLVVWKGCHTILEVESLVVHTFVGDIRPVNIFCNQCNNQLNLHKSLFYRIFILLANSISFQNIISLAGKSKNCWTKTVRLILQDFYTFSALLYSNTRSTRWGRCPCRI